MKRSLAAALAVGLALLAAHGADDAKPRTTVGTDVCIRCHIDFARRWAALDHSKAMLSDEFPPERRGCEACHGPGGDHVAGRRAAIIRWDRLDVPQRAATCLQCHQGKVEAELWQATPHSELMGCDQCHEVHRAVERDDLLRAPEGQECSPCHDDLPARAAAGEHHSLADGALTCNQCHAFHGSEQSSLLIAPMETLCQDCHGDEVPKPPSHEQEGWRLHHGGEAKGNEAKCQTCHDQQRYCGQCHFLPLPHPEDFAVEHAAIARQRQDGCMQCHEADFCRQCHEDVPVKPAGDAAQ